jgi:hypothetical protein
MNWEEIETEDRPVTFVECAILARYGAEVKKGEHWVWQFPNFDTAHDCFKRLKPGKYEFKGTELRLKEPPMAEVWTVQLANARQVAMVHSKVFRAFPTVEKLEDKDPDSFFHWVNWTEMEKQVMIRAYLSIQEYRKGKPHEDRVQAPYLIQGPELLKDERRPFLLIVSWQKVL